MQINYHGYHNNTGYSISAQDYILSMLRSNPDLNIKFTFLNASTAAGKIGVSEDRFNLFKTLQKKDTNGSHINLFHCIPPLYRRSKGAKKHIGFCVYETIDPPRAWINNMNDMDCIITASQFNKHIFENSGVKKPIHVVPHCFDPQLFNKDAPPKGRYEPVTFLSIGTWKKRKNFETLIKGFYDAFDKNDNVCLLIKTDKPDKLQSSVHQIKRHGEWRAKDTAPIYKEEKKNCTFEEIPQLMKKADIVVSPSLGEGFGLVGLHTMALNIPLIITKYSGTLEYAKPEYCTYFEPKSYQKYSSMDGIPQFRNKIWPVLKTEEIKNKLRYAYENIKLLKSKSKSAYEYVHNNYTYDVIGKQFIEVLEEN